MARLQKPSVQPCAAPASPSGSIGIRYLAGSHGKLFIDHDRTWPYNGMGVVHTHWEGPK
jgi:hypothetical protein